MKKCYIFLFALTLLFTYATFINQKQVKAEANYNIKIFTPDIGNENTNLENFYFEAGYAQNQSLTFIAELYDGDSLLNLGELTYNWIDLATEKVVSENRSLVLNKAYNDNPSNVIMLGEKKYKITITADAIEIEAELTVSIFDDVNHEIILTKIVLANENEQLTTDVDGAYVLNNKSSVFTIKALLSKSKVDCTINWFIKTPNSSTFDLFYENGNCKIEPAKLINSDNGFGTYKIYASAQSSSVLFTSKIIYFKGIAGELNDSSDYKIIKNIINNTKSDLEAYTFSLENAIEDCLDFNKILWYINDIKYGKGRSFSYEPTTSEPFVISVQYQGPALVKLSELSVTPKTTGTLKLILFILGGVLVLSTIFMISVKTLNKKRDVVW